jgi:hypothetical protein
LVFKPAAVPAILNVLRRIYHSRIADIADIADIASPPDIYTYRILYRCWHLADTYKKIATDHSHGQA